MGFQVRLLITLILLLALPLTVSVITRQSLKSVGHGLLQFILCSGHPAGFDGVAAGMIESLSVFPIFLRVAVVWYATV